MIGTHLVFAETEKAVKTGVPLLNQNNFPDSIMVSLECTANRTHQKKMSALLAQRAQLDCLSKRFAHPNQEIET